MIISLRYILIGACSVFVLALFVECGSAGSISYLPQKSEQSEQVKMAPLSKESQPRKVFALEVPFAIRDHGVLFVGLRLDKAALPFEQFERLYLRLGRRIMQVSHLDDLRGVATINSPKEALAFVRLRTSPRTWYLDVDYTGKNEVEVMDLSQVDKEFCFGDKGECDSLCGIVRGGTSGSGYMGILGPCTSLSKLGLQPAKSVKAGSKFTITRWLLAEYHVGKGEKLRLLNVKETVGKDGRYSRVVLETRQPPSGIFWYIKKFE